MKTDILNSLVGTELDATTALKVAQATTEGGDSN